MVNRMILQGRFVADPELRYSNSDVAYTEFTVAWSENYKEIEKKCFLRCKAWRSTAEFIGRYFRKGQEIVIEGQMLTEQWKQDGENKSRTICNIEHVNFCGSKSGNDNAPVGAPNQTATDNGFMNILDGIDEELPFN